MDDKKTPGAIELNDDALDAVSGGIIYKDNRPIVSRYSSCGDDIAQCWKCKDCGGSTTGKTAAGEQQHECSITGKTSRSSCMECKYVLHQSSVWVCDNPTRRKQ